MSKRKRILIKPYVTEKTTRLMEEAKYTFVVSMDASKTQIREAVQDRYPEVKIENVRTQIVPAKRRRRFTRSGVIEGRTSGFKKAIVKLNPEEGELIDFFEQI
jgi:large subunit ribosomal protein L23